MSETTADRVPGLSGGLADKLGYRYEGRWTVLTLTRLLADELSAIELEPYDGTKIELRAQRQDEVVEHHQAKRRAPGGGSWTARKLAEEGILEAIAATTGPASVFVFVSASPIAPAVDGLWQLANQSPDAGSFDARLSEERRADLARLRSEANDVPSARVWEMLRGASFRQRDEESLREHAVDRLRALVAGDPDAARGHLSDYLEEHIGQRIVSSALWRYLQERRVAPRALDRDPTVRLRVARLVESFSGDSVESQIHDLEQQRAEVDQIVSALASDSGQPLVIVGAGAGMGKSVVVRQLVRRKKDDWLILPLRLDTLADAASSEAVGHQLGLPASPVHVLAQLSPSERCVLVVDQLDAVSQVSGRNARGYDAVAELLREAEAFSNVRVVLACRQFDLDADVRLKRLRDRDGTVVVEVGLLDDGFIDQVLGAIGLPPAQLTAQQRQMLRIPLNLRLLSEAGVSRGVFSTELDLFAAYWDEKLRLVRVRGGDQAEAAGLLEALARLMSDQQALDVPVALAPDRPLESSLLRSEHVLVEQDGRVRFFHERLFDFAFARRFAREQSSLAAFVKTTEQGLFRRSQVRQVLAYRRESDTNSYARDLVEMLLDPDVRVHLKLLIVRWLRTLPQPTVAEWAAVYELLESEDERLRGHVLSLISGSPAMFDLADEAGVIGAWLNASDEALRDRAFVVLAGAQRARPARVAGMIAGFDCASERDRQRLTYLVRWTDLAADEAFFEFFLRILTAGCLDELERVFAVNDTFWSLAHELTEKQPAWMARFISGYLRRRLALAAASGASEPLRNQHWVPDPLERDLFSKAALGAPEAFSGEILPLVVELIEGARSWNEEEQRYVDSIWRYRWVDNAHGVAQMLIAALEAALCAIAISAPDRFAEYRDALVSANSSSLDHIIAKGYASAPERFADAAVDWIIENPARLDAGYVDSSYWVGRELVAAIWPQLTATRRGELEAVLLGYYPQRERSRAGYRPGYPSFGHAQYVLIGGVPFASLSEAAQKRMQESTRKFGPAPNPPRRIEAAFIGSPIPTTAVARMTDDQWVAALGEYVGVDHRFVDRPSSRAGGALQLGQQLQEATSREPTRFAQLATRLSDDLASTYGDAILLGLRKADVDDAEPVFGLIRRLHALPGRPAGRYLAAAVARVAERHGAPDDILDVVAWYGTHDPNPSTDGAPSLGPRYGQQRMELLNFGINTTRGATASAMADLLRVQPAALSRWQSAIQAIAEDPSDAVRSCVAEVLLVALDIDREWAIDLAAASFQDHDDVATSAYGERLLSLALRTHPDAVLPAIRALVSAEDVHVARVGARLACIAALLLDDSSALIEQALNGNSGARLGVAEIFSANVGESAYASSCEAGLRVLFHDDDSDVRQEAGSCFRSLVGRPLGENDALFIEYAESPAIADNPSDVLACLVAASSLPSAGALKVGQAILDAAGPAAGDVSTSWAAEMPEVATLAARLHADADPDVRLGALDLIDALATTGAYGFDRAIAQYER